jgi:hypothetical protein
MNQRSYTSFPITLIRGWDRDNFTGRGLHTNSDRLATNHLLKLLISVFVVVVIVFALAAFKL